MSTDLQFSAFRKNARVIVMLWSMLFLASLFADRPMAQWVHDHTPFDKRSPHVAFLVAVVKSPGDYRLTISIAALLLLFHPRAWRAAILPLIAGAAGGFFYSFIKWGVGRHRPVIQIAPFKFQPFLDGWIGFFKDPGLSFPSGHATLSFATATSLTLLLPKWKYVWFSIALTVAAERVLENAHYVSDVVAGAALGTLMALMSDYLIRVYWPDKQSVAAPLAAGTPAS